MSLPCRPARVAGDQEEGVLVGSADGGGLLGMGAADDETDAGVAVLTHVVLAEGSQAVADKVVNMAAVIELFVLKVLGAGVGGAAQDKDALALLGAVRQIGLIESRPI